MSKRNWSRSLVAIALTCSNLNLACGGTMIAADEQAEAAASSSSDEALFRARLRRTQEAFLALDGRVYRRYVMSAVGAIDAESNATRRTQLALVLDEMAKNGDGLEAIVLAYTDAIAASGTAAGKAAATSL